MYWLRLFYKNYINVCCVVSVSYMYIYFPNIMCGIRLFIVVFNSTMFTNNCLRVGVVRDNSRFVSLHQVLYVYCTSSSL